MPESLITVTESGTPWTTNNLCLGMNQAVSRVTICMLMESLFSQMRQAPIRKVSYGLNIRGVIETRL